MAGVYRYETTPLIGASHMPKVARRGLVAAVVVIVGALAIASVVSAKSTVNLRASKTKLAFNHKTLTAKRGTRWLKLGLNGSSGTGGRFASSHV